MAEPRALIALLLLAIVVLHFFVGERARKHAFSRDPPPRPAPRWRLRPALVGEEEEVLLELVCARDGRSLYCAGDDARCVADDTVPLFRRAWNRAASGGRGDVALTQTDETGRRVRLEARDGRVVCAPALGDDDAEQAAAGAAWRFAKARGRAGLVAAASRRFVDVVDVDKSRGHLLLAASPAAPFAPRRVDAAEAAASVDAHEAAVAAARADDAAARLELRRRFEASLHGETRVIAMALYGADDKYCEGALRNSELVDAYFPTWRLRVYADADSVPRRVLDALERNGADVRAAPFGFGAAEGMFRRFSVADDPAVDRFVVRDSDSRLNPRDAFAVAAWCESGWAVHSVRDHPNHARYLNGGMWGATKRSRVHGAIAALAADFSDHDSYGADLDFLDVKVLPLVLHDILAHDAYTCDSFPGSKPFPTRRPFDFQHVGQVFDADGKPRLDDVDSFIRGRPVPANCRGDPAWTYG